MFFAEVTEAKVLSDVPPMTYDYYFAHVKPQPQPAAQTRPAAPQPQRADGFPPPPEAPYPAPQPKTAKKRSKAPLIIGIVAGVLVLLAVLWGLIGRRLFAPYEMQTEPVDPSLHTASQNEFWNGDWYGWWIIESGTGDYALSEGGCARIHAVSRHDLHLRRLYRP